MELNAEEIVKRYINEEPIFKLPQLITTAEGLTLQIPEYKSNNHHHNQFPPRNLIEDLP